MSALLAIAFLVLPSAPAERPAWRAHDEVVLSPELEAVISEIAAAYHAKTKRMLEVTSGVRTPERQAAAMYRKLAVGGSLALYKRQSLIAPIRKAYRDGRRARMKKEAIIAAMAEVIAAQVSRGEFISRHLKGRAFDARSVGLTGRQRSAFLTACRESGKVKVIVESKPPHFHVELLDPKPPDKDPPDGEPEADPGDGEP